jgi:hypothetical protein
MSMYRFRDTSISGRARPLSRLWLFLAVVLAIPLLALMVVPAEFSVLVQPDGTTRWFFNRQFDLPTGDPAVFHDYSLAPLFWCFLGCSLFYFIIHRLVLRYAA